MSLWWIPAGWFSSKAVMHFYGFYSNCEGLNDRKLDADALIETCKAMLDTYENIDNHAAVIPMNLLQEAVDLLEKTINEARGAWSINYRHYNEKIKEAVHVVERRLNLFMRALQLPNRNSASLRESKGQTKQETTVTDTL